ncbi:MAG: SUMF1/EgtB/PvdO family nonheme iron enzyme [Anaerolineales bacterium]|nr:SUMF1/EgtB/PvdO family nonheme iron enzyme [Anaerolineales bacterium]
MRKQIPTPSLLVVLLLPILSSCNLPLSAEPSTPPPAAAATETITSVEGAPATLPPIDWSDVEAGTTMLWYDNSLLVFVPKGEFLMGNDGRDTPQHGVSIDDFWVYKTMTTNDMYRLCVAANICTPPTSGEAFPNYLDPEIKDHPVVGVNWEQAQTYCEWMNAHLPTEAQWEKTARGPNGNPYPWGDAQPTCSLLNYEACELKQTTKVYDYPEGLSFYEAADMAGNAYEWTADWYAYDYYDQSPDVNPTGPEEGTVRVVRGSSFTTREDSLLSALRFGLEPNSAREDLGFRCVVGADAFQYAPFCQLTAHIPNPGRVSPFPPEGSPGAIGEGDLPVCEADPPELRATQYCADQGTSTGGATVTYSGELVSTDPGCIAGPSPMGCTAHEGSTLEVELCNTCLPAVMLAGDFAPTCAAGYALVDGMCEFAGLPPDPGGECPPGWFLVPEDGSCIAGLPPSELCPEGFAYHAPSGCCAALFTTPSPEFAGIPPHAYPGCPIGTDYDPASGFCVITDLGEVEPEIACETFTITVGYCEEGGNNDNGTCQRQVCGGQAPVWCEPLCSCIGPADPCP